MRFECPASPPETSSSLSPGSHSPQCGKNESCGSVCGSPVPVGIMEIVFVPWMLTASTHLPSCESACEDPSPSRNGGEPSVGRRYITPAAPPASPDSSNNNVLPSVDSPRIAE